MIVRILRDWKSRRAWNAFQQSIAEQREDARAHHKPIRDINARQAARVRAALEAGR